MATSAEAIRKANMAYLNEHGFKPADWLPLLPEAGTTAPAGELGGVLRPTEELVRRYMALFGVFAWGSAPPEMEASISSFLHQNALRDMLGADERLIVELPKAEAAAEHQGRVGWRLENMWALAWILGFTPPPSAVTGQLEEDVSRPMMADFLPDFSVTVEALLARTNVQSDDEVVQLHDRFYCAHNAVRSAQVGGKTVPPDFDPIGAGGAIHERRHSLTWALSPGVTWDDTVLDT